ncbi:NAD(P)H-dependent glycerol-3-phosphate dehydrogenase [Ferruginibacter sp.]|uniref:NAD(P)H-dependent glycerol-3-phosphate dehydrogenase n=1 Tax=Ferruginibacter sp. TaxID=1940288 RepID=UPI00199B7FEF|nr:NAD(P)H-dependent glycerol-3-phosphate dehydrogenase [Ferruginibacter sp.]MBC7626200.1 NAD(P)-binding domain-containing protein [Ferruginibacter sp.]
MNFGILGSGSWGTALAKVLTDNGQTIYWYNRSQKAIDQMMLRRHNAHYLSAAYFDTTQLKLTTNVAEVIAQSDCIIIAIPSAYVESTLSLPDKNIFAGKKIVSAVKGILPSNTLLLNDYLKSEFSVALEDYFTILGPCHAEEVAAEKLSYLTFSGIDEMTTHHIAQYFKTDYLNTVENTDIYGVQYAAVLKNIYAVGAGMAHGLDYGDNFLSVLIANCADEMAGFLKMAGIKNVEVGHINNRNHNYASSVYLGDLLVTCYSLFSRNRTFGNMIGKGYSVKSAQIEMSMVAEGYNASKSIYIINQTIKAAMPIAETVYQILWNGLDVKEAFDKIEPMLV